MFILTSLLITENFFPTARSLIGDFKVTGHLIMTKSEDNTALSSSNDDRRPPLQEDLMHLQQNQKSNRLSLRKQ